MNKNTLRNIPLAAYTTWKIGGVAKYLVEPLLGNLREALTWCAECQLPVYVLGRSSNVLIDDSGLPGLVVITCNSLTKLCREDNFIVAESGVSLPRLSRFAAHEGFSGFEFLIGIPGTVGGAVAMNAGLTVFRPREMTDIVKDFDVLNLDGTIKTLTMADVHAGYRYTSLLDDQRLVLKVRFHINSEGEPNKIRRSTLEHLRERKRKQPLDKPTAGSTFKSPSGGKSAGWYIEQAGLKGFEFGGARVSPVHANWIENMGSATSADVRHLIDYIQTRVDNQLGIQLEPEVRFLP
ncbi:UDP-N-acetylmuramate dehydrogenase [Leptolyngbya sp. KIOST-1]|uniref:UDP-N-acetylmuramate dehydrogenase n=1 Tax=Leptolyngbya sp. KIOST-1 TaxID=1229172 RepID=UPI000907B731|nr:UDP-N-acetylmuramate dehydrogenase [Leptolyngbya sp. KIOST-1]